jgi:hypothetical protein
MPSDFATILARDITARRISVELVREAYSVSGLKPVCSWLNLDEHCGCPLGAIYVCATVNPSRKDGAAREWSQDTFGVGYAMDFVDGFDDAPRADSIREHRGWQDGRAAREAVLGKGAAG